MPISHSIIIAITSGAIVSIFNYLLIKDREKAANKMKVYASLLDNARAFLDDPNLSKSERREIKKEFLKKYYNEVILFADKNVRKEIEDFIHTGGVSATNPGKQVTKLKNMIIAIRKDLGNNDEMGNDFKMYSLEIGEERN